MKNLIAISVIIALATLLDFTKMIASPEEGKAVPEQVNVVIISPGGPEEEKEVQRFVGQYSGMMAKEASLDPAAVSSRYFTAGGEALDYLSAQRDSFIIGSLGFFLSQRRALSLIPLAKVELATGPNESYYLMVKKGRYRALTELKGKTLEGNALYEDPAFLSKIVFDSRLDAAAYFILKPTRRPLSSLRRPAEGKVDAVLLDQTQYKSLALLPLAKELEAVYTSPRLPDVGVMMADTPLTRKLKDRFLKALDAMSASEEGGKALKSFGVTGFKQVSPDEIADVVKKFDGAPVKQVIEEGIQ